MLEKVTVIQLFTFLFSPSGLAIILDRIPAWKNWKSQFKGYIVMALGVAAGFILPAVLAAIPQGVGDLTLDKLIVSLFAAAAAFVVHYIDQLLGLAVTSAKAKLGIK